ncbi:unnamed protein product [Hyaloperonospora brassicae]|uniref:Uncharacterized protein n=1 Tax=Hyaloperonospora brassicae TaxID=162125 RepID=A0AAV0U8S5_HYABA|nr:unnamed protein product [Hyaloperonospora brassicae]
MSRPQLDGTALDLFARRPTRSFRTNLNFLDSATKTRDGEECGYRPRQVVELCGASDTPTMRVLEHVVVSFLMKSCKGPAQTGNERVVIFDHEYQVSTARIEALVSCRLAASEQDEAVKEALSRVQICHCRDSFQWLATLNYLHFELLEVTPAPLMLVVNTVGSFHAIDKMTAKSVGSGLALSDQVFVYLKQFIQHHSPIVFATKETTSAYISMVRMCLVALTASYLARKFARFLGPC